MSSDNLEKKKIELEIKKLQIETNKFKRIAEWLITISTLTTALVAVGTLIYAIQQDVIKNLVEKLKNDNQTLSRKVINLKKDIDRLTHEKNLIISETNKKKIELKYLNEHLGRVNQKLVNTEDCYVKAYNFIKYFCANDLIYNDRTNHPLVLRFKVPNKQIVEANISNISFIDFLKSYAGYIEQEEIRGEVRYLSSNDTTFTRTRRKILIYTSKRYYDLEIAEPQEQFECWKNLPKGQKLKILTQVIVK